MEIEEWNDGEWNTEDDSGIAGYRFPTSFIPFRIPFFLPSVNLRASGLAELDAIKLGIKPATRHQLVVGAFLGDHAVFENEDFVGIPDCAQPVRDGDHGAPLHEPLQSVDHQFFRLGVERGGGFIENKDRRVADDRAGNADALPLAARERETALAHQGFVTFGHAGDKLIRVC